MTDSPSLADRVQAMADEEQLMAFTSAGNLADRGASRRHVARYATLTKVAEALRRMEADIAQMHEWLANQGVEIAQIRARLTVDDAMVERFRVAYNSTEGAPNNAVRAALEAALRENPNG